MIQKFSPKVDFISIIVTSVVLLCIFISFKYFLYDTKSLNIFYMFIILISLFMILYFIPVSYILTDNKLIIKKILSKKIIELERINSVIEIKSSIVFTYSTKGFFGYLGKTMDGSISYSTSLKNNLLIRTIDNEKIIISPSKIDLFQEELRKQTEV